MARDHTVSFLEEAKLLRDTAAHESLERIRADRSKAPPRVKPLLEYLEGHLFEKSLNVNHLKQACGIRDNSIALLFHAQVGQSPKAYISERRLETAAKLLRESDLRIWQISELVGYSGLAVFGKAFARWSGQRPGRFREEARELVAAGEDPFEGPVDDQYLRMALAGALPTRQACSLIRRLLTIYRGAGAEARAPDQDS